MRLFRYRGGQEFRTLIDRSASQPGDYYARGLPSLDEANRLFAVFDGFHKSCTKFSANPAHQFIV